MSATNQNGARAKILRALAEYGLMPVSELAAAACLSPSQARDNANHAVTDGLITKCRDDITNTLAYKITAAGRGYLAERCRKSEEEPAVSAAVEAKPDNGQATLEQFIQDDFMRWPKRYPGGEDAYLHGNGSESAPAYDAQDDVVAICATDPEPLPEQYAICRSGQAHLSAWPLRDMTIEAARQLAIDDAAAIGGEVVLYRCVPIGKAFPRIVFEEA